jgi:rhamnose utilization protein RhaD (predicted bifunctional aldolase and dehydrogenase)
MENIWSDVEESRAEGELEKLVYAVRLLQSEGALGPEGIGRSSLKRLEKNLLGEAEEILYIDSHRLHESRRMPGGGIAAGDFSPVRSRWLARLAGLEQATPAQLENELACSRTSAVSPVPPLESILHAVLPYRVLLSGEPEAILSIACTPDGPDRLKEVFGERVRVVSPLPGGLGIARACAQALGSGDAEGLEGIFVLYTGLIAFGDTARQAYERMVELNGFGD